MPLKYGHWARINLNKPPPFEDWLCVLPFFMYVSFGVTLNHLFPALWILASFSFLVATGEISIYLAAESGGVASNILINGLKF